MLAAAVDIKNWLRKDRQTPYGERLDRDREIGLSLAVGTDHERVLAWWSRVSSGAGDSAGDSAGERLESLQRLASAGLFVLGLVVGVGIGGVALRNDGGYPVNLFALLGVLVGIPLVLLAVTLVLLPGRVPGLSVVRRAAAGINPGRWVGAWLDRVVGVDLFGGVTGRQPASAYARWQLVVFSQWLAVGFFAGVLGAAWLLVAFTDLALGWSTTLQIESATVLQWFSALASPWSAWLPAAVPDAALVEASRFYRLQEGGMPASRAAQLGQWWPFVIASITTYGLLPRFVLLIFGGWRLKSATRLLLREDPEVTALLDRLNTPRVSYEGEAESQVDSSQDALPAPAAVPLDESAGVIVWNDAASTAAVGDFLQTHLGIAAAPPVALSILQEEGERRRRLSDVDSGVRRLFVFTKGWEPPLLEFSDFLDTLRSHFGPQVSLTVVPVDVGGESVRPDGREVWARALARQHDPRLYVLDADQAVRE